MPTKTHGSPAKHTKSLLLTPTYGKLAHIIVVIQENRTVDNLFNGATGVDTVPSGLYSPPGQLQTPIPLAAQPLLWACDPGHKYFDFQTDVRFDGTVFHNDNFTQPTWGQAAGCPAPAPSFAAYSYVPQTDVQNYWSLASQYAMADHVYQMSMGPSYGSHQYLIAGQTGGITGGGGLLPPYAVSDNPNNGSNTAQLSATSGCDAAVTNLVTIDTSHPYVAPRQVNQQGYANPPCQNYQTIFGLMEAAQSPAPSARPNWRYVSPYLKSIWNAPLGVSKLYNEGLTYGGFLYAQDEVKWFYNTVHTGNLPQLTYIVPCSQWSDHPGVKRFLGNTYTGPNDLHPV
jgi:hypothetical protein